MHQHIVKTGITLLAQSGLPFKYWTEAFSTAVHLINRLPIHVLQLNYLLKLFIVPNPIIPSSKCLGIYLTHI